MKRPVRVALVIALMVVAAACGGDEPGARPTPTATATDLPTTTTTPTSTSTGNPAGPNSIAVIDNSFDPPELTVTVGTEVTWTNQGGAPHSVNGEQAFDSHPDCDTANFDKCMQPGQVFRHTFAVAGRFAYSCNIHGPLMSGAIVVQ